MTRIRAKAQRWLPFAIAFLFALVANSFATAATGSPTVRMPSAGAPSPNGATKAITPPWLTDPVALRADSSDQVVLKKELHGFPNYGLDGASDVLYTGQAGSWDFMVPGDRGQVSGGVIYLKLALDDHAEVPWSAYSLQVDVNGSQILSGAAESMNVPHGGPYDEVFTNWKVVQVDLSASQLGSGSTVTVAMRNTSTTTSEADWIAIDNIVLALDVPVSADAADYSWLQYGSRSSPECESAPQVCAPSTAQLEARAIVTGAGAQCPVIVVDLLPEPMVSRAPFSDDTVHPFPLSCSYPLPPTWTTASVGDDDFSVPRKEPERILVIGDTGCRIKRNDVQDCKGDPATGAWNFAGVADQASQLGPDLIVHVGDYVYREIECPADMTSSCGGSPHGDTWNTWETDFFDPVGDLLTAAPWVFVRGNHEGCVPGTDPDRQWRGFLRFLDGSSLDPNTKLDGDTCPPFLPSYTVAVPSSVLNVGTTVDVLVLDTSSDPNPSSATSPAPFAAEFQDLFKPLADLPRVTWTATHRPFWGWENPRGTTPGPPVQVDSLLETYLPGEPGSGWPRWRLAFAGHIHMLQRTAFDECRPPQVVSGAGGTKRDSYVDPESISQAPHRIFQNYADSFGYVYLDVESTKWTATYAALPAQSSTSELPQSLVIEEVPCPSAQPAPAVHGPASPVHPADRVEPADDSVLPGTS